MGGIRMDGVTKHYRVLKRREGLGGAVKDLFSRNYDTVKAVDGISLSVEPGSYNFV